MQILQPERDLQDIQLRFEVVPAYDLIISLAAAADPQRYELDERWTRAVRSALPASVRRDLGYFFGDPLSLGAGAVQLVPELLDGTPETVVHSMRDMDPAGFVGALLSRGAQSRALRPALQRLARGKSLSAADTALVHAHVDGLRAETRKRLRAMLAEPRDARDRYAALLCAHAAGAFATTYGELQPFLVQRAKHGRRSIGKLPTKEVIGRVTGGFTVQDPAARSVLLTPSYYAAPFVFVVGDDRDVVMVYGVRPSMEADAAPLDVQSVRILKALADETRLRILQLLGKRPLYGQQLAAALGMSHPTISHHMGLLRSAGLVRTELGEDGNKTYWVRPETIESIAGHLRGAFVEPDALQLEAP